MSCILTKHLVGKNIFLSLRCLHVTRYFKQNHYDLLGVSKSASQEEIKKAYFALSKENHPDRHPNDNQKLQKFLNIKDAYSVLSNPTTRQRYDDSLSGRSYGSPYNSERYSSAYRNHPFTQKRYSNPYRDHFHSEEPRYWTPRDRMDMYWDNYYNHRTKYRKKYGRKTPNDPILTFLERNHLNLVQYFILIVFCMLSVRYAKGKAGERRVVLEEIEEKRHMDVKKRADEVLKLKKEYKEHLRNKNNSVIPDSKLEEA